jgi:predicted MFS family arabinose efflux permease
VLILTVFSVMGGFTIYPYLAEMLNQIAGYHGDAITAVLLLLGLGGTAGNFFGGYASDMWDIRRLLLCLLALLAADYALLSVSGEIGLPSRIAGPLAAVVVFLWGLISWAIPVAQQARMVRLAGALAPIALSLNQSALYLGIAAGSALGSVMVAFGSVKALGFAGAACAGVGFLWLAIPMRSANADARDALS